jgi:hypothetical protein
MKNSSIPKLPSTSRYHAAEKQIVDLAVGNDNDGVKRMSAEEFAGKVANDVVNGANGKIWRGGYSSMARVFNVLMPTGVLVSFPPHLFVRFVCSLGAFGRMAYCQRIGVLMLYDISPECVCSCVGINKN